MKKYLKPLAANLSAFFGMLFTAAIIAICVAAIITYSIDLDPVPEQFILKNLYEEHVGHKKIPKMI